MIIAFYNAPNDKEWGLFLAILIPTLTAIFGFMAGFYLGRRNIRIQEYFRASAEFRKAFNNILIFLEESGDKSSALDKIMMGMINTEEAIAKDIRAQQSAYIGFLPYLGKINRFRFQKAWENYANPQEDKKKPRFSYSASLNRYIVYKTNTTKEETEIKKIIKKRIDKILKFAKVR